jgi:NitT/TauT family transport system ATP-binding protein
VVSTGGGRDEVSAELSGVTFSYPGGVQAVRDLDLVIPTGRILGIVGPSGCGKSTILSMLAGLRAPSAGTVRVWLAESEKRHPVAMVFQTDTLLPWLTVAGNVKLHFAFVKGGMTKAEVEQWTAELLHLVSLTQYSNLYPYQLSGGMRRRVAFLAAVAARPRLLLLDEPFSALDEPTRIGVHQDVLAIVKKFAMTVILVTHDLAEALSLSDRVVVLTRRPGTVASIHDIPFVDRNVLEVRKRADFLEYYGLLWEELSQQIRDGSPAR